MLKKIKNISLLLFICLLFSEQINATNNYVICDINWLSENTAQVKINWKNPNSQKLMITGWQMENGYLKISYQPATTEEYSSRIVTVAEKSFPCQVRLVHAKESQIQEMIFTDLVGFSEQNKAILNLYYQGILGGYPDGSFLPTKNVSRAEFAKIIFLATKMEKPKKEKLIHSFQDIEKNWAKEYILALAQKEILKGKGEGIFDPNGNVTLGEVLTVLNRSFYLYHKENIPSNSLPSHWSNLAYIAMKNQGVVQRKDDIYQNYQPNRPATREEVAQFLSRILEQKHDIK